MISVSATLKFGIGPKTKKSVTFPPFPINNPYPRSSRLPRAPLKTRISGIVVNDSLLFTISFTNQTKTHNDKINVYPALSLNRPNAIPVLYV